MGEAADGLSFVAAAAAEAGVPAEWVQAAVETLVAETTALAEATQALDYAAFGRAVKLILERPAKRVVVTGVGKSGHIAHKIAATLSSTGTPAVYVSAAEGVHGDLGMVGRGEVVLAFSYRGESDEIVALLPSLARLGTKLIAVTGRTESTLAQHAEVVLNVAVEREACPHNLAPTSSTTVMLAVGDALAMTLMRARRFGTEDYALLHPGGSLGRQLLLTVGDIMRAGGDQAMVRADQTVQEALLVMTQAPVRGVTNVVDDAGRLVGVFTDGDLRVKLEQHGAAVLAEPVSAVMGRNPTTITPDRLATEALAIMQSREFDNLCVVDGEGRAVGIVDVQDLLRAGLS
ncbi:MAG: KpsF/GutQ family sugar-phosphate isomerase [Armatimonadetes bacterium]|nr:KpsF/GutQ family sugar-phosphate isomerase [Armatimonadota bacterium]